MTIGELLEAAEAQRRRCGTRANTVVCRPEHLGLTDGAPTGSLRLLFAEHGLRLQVDAASPWSGVTFLWIDPATVPATA